MPKKPAAKKTAKPPVPAKVPGPLSLLKSALTQLKRAPKLLAVVAIVLIPTTLLTLTGNTQLSAFATLASLLMNLALIWAIIELANNRSISIKDAYYKGTAALVQFVIVALLLVVMLVPLIFGLSLIGIGVLPPGTLLPERILLGLLALLLVVPTVYWLVRYVFSLFIICETPVGPIAALRRSGQLVKGRFALVLGRLALVGAIMAIVGLIPLIAVLLLHTDNHITIAIIQTVSGLIGLPVLNLYLHQLYKSL